MMAPPLLVTPGEPAGIGPELAVLLACEQPDLVLVADPALLESTLKALASPARVVAWDSADNTAPRANTVRCWPVALRAPSRPGQLDAGNARYVLDTLDQAVDLIANGRARGLVTGPVHKAIINDAGITFSGHTEYLAAKSGIERVVMMLVAGRLRVALATTHLPLARVADAIARDSLLQTIGIIHHDLSTRFAIARPRIAVLGLNPHAGEGGHLGREEIEVIGPALRELQDLGMDLVGPLPADTAFLPSRLEHFDVVLAMYHDQGLPVLKYAGFGQAVNVTLGLPWVRTSVDHGTALDLAGTGTADPGSFRAAVALAREMTG
ncbi:MAG: 4-hydroxythreonine-4-phosphate dehydrogenase PdxA [Wenzhouxiangellaceae bacterium]|nr:4-hydroxythreonine-4-phosphate dehydrogenase PdxA [Wenzhouxiangellaceae bacterium]